MRLLCLIFFCVARLNGFAATDTTTWWHDKERVLRYHPEGQDIVITNGSRRFTRALYGTHTAFRVEAGDLPEFALYMPGMGGNIQFGLVQNTRSKWLIRSGKITARYRAGSMLYDIEDDWLGKGKITIVVQALADAEGVVIKIQTENIPSGIQLVWVYGGATGKKFSRDGDMGPDPESSFYLKPEYCKDNRYRLSANHFELRYGTGEVLSEEDRYENKNLPGQKNNPIKGKEQSITGVFPPSSNIQLADAARLSAPLDFYQSGNSQTPAVTGMFSLKENGDYYFGLQKTDTASENSYAGLLQKFEKAETYRKEVAGQIVVNTPDPYINTLGGVLSIAADAIWEEPSYLHGAIGWRMRLNGWRGAYAGDVMGWHNRARMHFSSYAKSQVLAPDSGRIVPDTALHFARQQEKMGVSLFTSGYISRNPGGDLRPHHYDMNLVFIDELLWHFRWTGDKAYIKEMWPLVKRHLAWEKRNFDPDGDGLYDAYAAIWASDALQYSGGSVTHSSAYMYRAFQNAAELASLLGEDPSPYQAEASRILNAVNTVLWLPEKGWYAEYKDKMGKQLLHPAAALWTVYHSIDSDVPDAFRAYQLLQYTDQYIPHIPMKAKGLTGNYYTLSTSNWMPYTWSLNNVALAELMHASLAYWQGGKKETAFQLWKSSLMESMYLGGSPGNIQQISTYDAVRGEAYRDFADPVGMTARSLVQGLFGIMPDAVQKKLLIKPGFPKEWDYASFHSPDIALDYAYKEQTDLYTIVPHFTEAMQLQLDLPARKDRVRSIEINGQSVPWKISKASVGNPVIQIQAQPAVQYTIRIVWMGNEPDSIQPKNRYARGATVEWQYANAIVKDLYDPQKLFGSFRKNEHRFSAIVLADTGYKTAFVQLEQGSISWWQPLSFLVVDPVAILPDFKQPANQLVCTVENNTAAAIKGKLVANNLLDAVSVNIPPYASQKITLSGKGLITGTNRVRLTWNEGVTQKEIQQQLTNWNISPTANQECAPISLSGFFNDKITRIFQNRYLSPRPNTATLQLPLQGMGDWTHPLLIADIDDTGLRKRAGDKQRITLENGITFQIPSDSVLPNIVFSSQWDNFPKEIKLPLSGQASHAYFLMAGTTNPMQTRLDNGAVIVRYDDNSADTLVLRNPETWWPIEQDYYEDGYAFTLHAVAPPRIHLKTGRLVNSFDVQSKKYAGKSIDGGAATLLDLPLQKNKILRELVLQTWANDVIIGLMGLSLMRD